MSSSDGKQLIQTHRELLERWRKAMNLVGPGPVQEHFDDCAAALRVLQTEPPTGRWADLGTGAGFPGLVFAATFPSVELELVDSRQKRCRFLEEVLATAEWSGVMVRRQRHEELESGAYDGIMSRALHDPLGMVKVARRLLRPGGKLVLFMQEMAALPEAPGFEMFHVEHYTVAGRQRKSVVLRFA